MVPWYIAILILTNCYGIMNLLLQKLTVIENQTFLRKLYTMKIWSHTVHNLNFKVSKQYCDQACKQSAM